MTLSKLEQTKRKIEQFAREVAARGDDLWGNGDVPDIDNEMVVEAIAEHGWLDVDNRVERMWAIEAYWKARGVGSSNA